MIFRRALALILACAMAVPAAFFVNVGGTVYAACTSKYRTKLRDS